MSDYGSGGGDQGPVFIDVYGTGRRLGLKSHRRGLQDPENAPKTTHGFDVPHPDGAFWKRGLKGLLPLSMVFWGGFFFGHGILLMLTIALAVPLIVIGLTVDPGRAGASMVVTGVFAGIVGTMIFLFLAWSLVAVWRCAPNVEHVKWAWAARLVVTLYAYAWGAAAWKFFV